MTRVQSDIKCWRRFSRDSLGAGYCAKSANSSRSAWIIGTQKVWVDRFSEAAPYREHALEKKSSKRFSMLEGNGELKHVVPPRRNRNTEEVGSIDEEPVSKVNKLCPYFPCTKLHPKTVLPLLSTQIHHHKPPTTTGYSEQMSFLFLACSNSFQSIPWWFSNGSTSLSSANMQNILKFYGLHKLEKEGGKNVIL